MAGARSIGAASSSSALLEAGLLDSLESMVIFSSSRHGQTPFWCTCALETFLLMELRDSWIQKYMSLVTISQLHCVQRLLRARLQLVHLCGKESMGPVSFWHTDCTLLALHLAGNMHLWPSSGNGASAGVPLEGCGLPWAGPPQWGCSPQAAVPLHCRQPNWDMGASRDSATFSHAFRLSSDKTSKSPEFHAYSEKL